MMSFMLFSGGSALALI